MVHRRAIYTLVSYIFFFNDTATTEIYTLSLHDALPICTSFHGRTVQAATTPFRTNGSPAMNSSAASRVVNTPIASPFIGSSKDRKSTRLNSSHANISYAVFCLQKKKIQSLH